MPLVPVLKMFIITKSNIPDFLLKKTFRIKRTSSSGFWKIKHTHKKTGNSREKIGKNHQFRIGFLIQFFKNLVKGQNQLLWFLTLG
jgi:hypothetical protein